VNILNPTANRTLRLPTKKWICLWPVVVLAWLGLTMAGPAQVPSLLTVRGIDRGTEYYGDTAAADAATEKVLQTMTADFLAGGQMLVTNRISYYETLYPNTNDDPYWGNYSFTSPVSGVPGTWVGIVATNQPGLPGLVPGFYYYNWTVRIAANAQLTNGGTGVTGAVWQDVAFIYKTPPAFQFAVFYNGTMEFSDCPTMTVNGPVFCNTNINVGSTSTATLTFNSFVAASGIITNPPAEGITQANWVQSHVVFSGTPSPGYGTGEPVIPLLGGLTNIDTTSTRLIINPPTNGESALSPIAAQRYYNKADMIIIITNALVPVSTNFVLVTNTNAVMLTNAVFITIKSSMFDTGNTYAVTNGVLGISNGINYTAEWANWVADGFTNWLSLTNTFYDQRQSAYLHVAQIDVGKLGQWIGYSNGIPTNTLLTGKWGNIFPFNGIIYIQDNRTTNATWQNCVRLVNGQNITNGLYSTGLTVATQNPLYIMGLYNCPGVNNVSSTNTIGCRPCSVICDALTILSPAWQTGGYDALSKSGPGSVFSVSRPASANDTVNTAIIAGNVPTTDTTVTGFSGGVQNLPRLLEDWSSSGLWLNTSMICLYTSAQATEQWQLPGDGGYYNAPVRHFSFDMNFLNINTLPPGTPVQTFPAVVPAIVERLDRLTPSPAADPSQ
jgi:hypothetical protein